jgi:caffeoyl-CoA O-methyltransferase
MPSSVSSVMHERKWEPRHDWKTDLQLYNSDRKRYFITYLAWLIKFNFKIRADESSREGYMDIHGYIMSLISGDNVQLEVIEREYSERDGLVPTIGPEVGKLLGLIIRAIGAKRAIEFGTCIGYSTIWLGEAMRATGGKLIAVEASEIFFKETRENVTAAGLSDYVEVIHGDASKVIDEVEGPFDLILQDSSKPLYIVMFERCVELLRINGILAADDGLFPPMGYEKPNAIAMDKYNRMAFGDPRLYTTLLPIGDGLTLSVKIRE